MAWILTSLLKSISLNSRSTISPALAWLGLGLVLANTATGSASADVPDQPPSGSNFLSQSATLDPLTDSTNGYTASESGSASVIVSKNLSEALRPAIAPQNPPAAPTASNPTAANPDNTDSPSLEMNRAIAAAEAAAAHAAGTSINPNGVVRIGVPVDSNIPATAPATPPIIAASTSASTSASTTPSAISSGALGAIAGSSAPFTFYPVAPGSPVGGTAAIPQISGQMIGQMPGQIPGQMLAPNFRTPGSPFPTDYGTSQSGIAGAMPQSPSPSAPFVFYMPPAQPGYPVQPAPSLGSVAGGPATYPATVIGYLPNGTPVPVIIQMPIAGYGYPSGSAVGYANSLVD